MKGQMLICLAEGRTDLSSSFLGGYTTESLSYEKRSKRRQAKYVGICVGAGVVAQWLRAVAALAEVLGSVLNNNMLARSHQWLQFQGT